MEKVKIGIYGGTGYTGLELIKLLYRHPGASFNFVTSERSAGSSLQQSYPQAPDIQLRSADETNLDEVDCVFLCLPHTQSAVVAARAAAQGVKVIDLSADLRLDDPLQYEKWYGIRHPKPELLPTPYGLPEINRAKLINTSRIANPGCYATSVLLGLTPLIRNKNIIPGTPIIVDAKSGVSGAGRTPKQHILFGEVAGNFSPYNIGRVHRHLGEIEQVLEAEGLPSGSLIFSPHLLPTERGILSSIYVQVNDLKDSIQVFHTAYDAEPLIDILPDDSLATLAHVTRTPKAVLSLTPVAEDMLIITVAIDNLLKGASSQAVPNFNLMFGFPETTGLRYGGTS